MSRSQRLKECVRFSLLVAGLSATAVASGAEESKSTLPEVVVTAQKRAESIQDVPIAVSAISGDDLTARGMDGGPQIVQAVPNVSFSKGNFTGFNLQIRGIGSKLVAAGGDAGVGIHLNNAPLAVSRFFEAEFFDLERVEVLRGPQGTLYGRNATGGVFNAITAKPTKEFESAVTADVGNYSSYKVKAMVNLPINDTFQARLAGSYLKRDGYNYDIYHQTDVDSRELYSLRATLAFEPTERFNGYFMWEHFKEDDDRQRTGAQLCTKDTGKTNVGGVSTSVTVNGLTANQFLSQGCLPGSLYSPAALGTINSAGSLSGELAAITGAMAGDAYFGQRISSDLRVTNSYFPPTYFATANIGELNFEFKLTDALTLTALTSYNDDEFDSGEDFNRTYPNRTFNAAAPLAPLLFPGGFFDDPQLGRVNTLALGDKSFVKSTTWTQELRLQSAFDGPLNFNIGAIYIDQDAPDQGYYVYFNAGTMYARCFNLPAPFTCNTTGNPALQIYVDPNKEPNGQGHNYYYNKQTFALKSLAGFGEVYWQMTDALKATLGLRYTNDEKSATSYDFAQQFLFPGQGFGPSAIKNQSVTFKETTGRAGFDWKVGGNTMLYAFYSKGYKGGGFNPATGGNVATTFDPEFVNAIEVGSKSTFFDGKVQLNATLFQYDYDGYQISRIVNLTAVNDNIDAKVKGAELEFAWQPLAGTRFDANLGFLRTEITGDEQSVDTMNRTQGNPALTVIKSSSGGNCVAPTANLAALINLINSQTPFIPTGPGTFRPGTFIDLLGVCSGSFAAAPLGITPSQGVAIQLAGNELPNAPHWTVNIGAQQTFNLGSSNWASTLRADYYKQGDSYARIYNSDFDRLEGWGNLNVSLSFDNAQTGLNVLLYVKNALDDDNITDAYLSDDAPGLYTNTFLTDPRLYGMAVTYKWR